MDSGVAEWAKLGRGNIDEVFVLPKIRPRVMRIGRDQGSAGVVGQLIDYVIAS